MTRIFYIILAALICVPLAAEEKLELAAEKEVAIVHFDRLKEQIIEGTAKDLILKPVIGAPDQTQYFALVNNQDKPREVILRILGLTEPEYDLYIDGNLIGVKSKEQLENGIPVSFSGTDIPPDLKDYYTRLRTKADEGAKLYRKPLDEETSRCKSVMQSVANWVQSIERGDALIRATAIIVVPQGTPLSLPGGRFIFQKPPDFPNSVKHLGEAVQIIRREIQDKTKNETLRFDTLSRITTIDFELTTSEELSSGSTITVTAKLANWMDRAVTGKVELDVPKEWTVRELSPTNFNMEGYSRSAEVKFEVTIPAAAGTDIKINAIAEMQVDDVKLRQKAVLKK